MTTTATQTITSTALQTALAAAQVLAVTNPKVAAALALAPFIEQLMADVEAMQQAGTLTPEKLKELFAKVSERIQTTQDEWDARNAADAATAK